MKIIVGLGNPGDKYENTRHNIGFDTVNYINDEYNGGAFQHEKKFFSTVSKIKIGSDDVLLLQPQTFMNESGKAVQAVKSFYKIDNKDIFVIHDDLDIPVGTFKIQTRRGSAGNKGVISIDKTLGTNDYYRMRIGITSENHSFFGALKKKFVLNRFSKKDASIIKDLLPKIKDALELCITDSPEASMNKYNRASS